MLTTYLAQVVGAGDIALIMFLEVLFLPFSSFPKESRFSVNFLKHTGYCSTFIKVEERKAAFLFGKLLPGLHQPLQNILSFPTM